ncbi:MAG: hypothetical protein MPW15_19585 [Candidatus Manganitrophus sp.]|nr:hypothetical protein [Candidatus Manganitrophus sp.]
MLLFICSTEEEIDCRLRLTSSAVAEITLAWVAVSSAFPLICWLTETILSEDCERTSELTEIAFTVSPIRSIARLRASPIWPISSRTSTLTRPVRSPWAIRSVTFSACET